MQRLTVYSPLLWIRNICGTHSRVCARSLRYCDRSDHPAGQRGRDMYRLCHTWNITACKASLHCAHLWDCMHHHSRLSQHLHHQEDCRAVCAACHTVMAHSNRCAMISSLYTDRLLFVTPLVSFVITLTLLCNDVRYWSLLPIHTQPDVEMSVNPCLPSVLDSMVTVL
jgi:hypothetical protein